MYGKGAFWVGVSIGKGKWGGQGALAVTVIVILFLKDLLIYGGAR